MVIDNIFSLSFGCRYFLFLHAKTSRFSSILGPFNHASSQHLLKAKAATSYRLAWTFNCTMVSSLPSTSPEIAPERISDVIHDQ